MNSKKSVAYFSLEIALENSLPTYAGGLGVLAGDTLRSAADIGFSMIGITLLNRQGYLKQTLDSEGNQKKVKKIYFPLSKLKNTKIQTSVKIGSEKVLIQAWQYIIKGEKSETPVILLDTDVSGNSVEMRRLTDRLYDSNKAYRLKQEIILGRGGVKILSALGYKNIKKYHVNEGHGSLAMLELYLSSKKKTPAAKMSEVKSLCSFTVHTPLLGAQDVYKKEFFLFKNRLKFLFKFGSLKQKIYELIRIPKTVFEEIKKRPFYLNFISLNISSIVNKILHFVLFLILINYFRPEEYAVYTLAWTQIGLLLPLLDFGTTSYGLVHINNLINKKIRELFSLRFYLSLITFILTIILAILFHYPTSILIPIILISFVIFANMLSGTYLILTSIKQKSYLVSLVSMIFQISLVISLIAGVLITKQLMPVFIITFVLYNLYSLVNFFLVRREVGRLSLKIDLKQWSIIIKKSFVFLLISLLAGFYSKVDVLILNFIKGREAVGIYSASYRFLDALMFVVTAYNVSSMPLFSKLAKEKKGNIFVNKIKKDVILVFAIGMFVALGFYFLGPIILPLVYKTTYFQSIQVLRIIIFALPLILLTSVFLNSIYALGKAKTIIYIFLFQLIFNIGLNLYFVPKFSFFGSAYITLLGEAINTLLTFVVLRSVLIRTDLIKRVL